MPLILKHLDLLSDIFTNWNLSQKHHVLTCGIINYLSGQTLCALRFWVGPGARLVKSARVAGDAAKRDAGDAANSKTAQ